MDYSLRPMLCKPGDGVPTGPEWVAEAKWDGWRIIIHVHDADRVQVFAGRNGNEYTGQLPYLQEAAGAMFPPDSVIDGELVGLAWGDAQSAMTLGEPVKGKPVKLVLFDVLRLAGHDLRSLEWLDRRSMLEQVFERHTSDVVQLNPVSNCSPEVHEAHLKAGFEGTVFKRKDSRYVNSRSPAWVKLKPKQSDEARITGFKPGKTGTRWEGKVGAFEIEMLDSGARTTVKCGTDARHEEAHSNPERWLNVVIEITHLGLGATGVPRSPNFSRRRDDRTAPKTSTKRSTKQEVRRMAPAVRRNYAAMADAKLQKVIGELRNGGDAAQRAEAKGFDPAEDLAIAEAIADQRGLPACA
jgi:ATP-dependent DNA ligase